MGLSRGFPSYLTRLLFVYRAAIGRDSIEGSVGHEGDDGVVYRSVQKVTTRTIASVSPERVLELRSLHPTDLIDDRYGLVSFGAPAIRVLVRPLRRVGVRRDLLDVQEVPRVGRSRLNVRLTRLCLVYVCVERFRFEGTRLQDVRSATFGFGVTVPPFHLLLRDLGVSQLEVCDLR